MHVSKLVHYGGRVQGVGFRLTAESLARRHPVAGYVKNLANGEVELVVEGLPHHVEEFLSDVAGQMANNIYECRIEDGLPLGLTDFAVRY